MEIYNLIFGPIIMVIGIVLFFKKHEIVKSGTGNKSNNPFLVKRDDETEELVLGAKLVLNIIGCGFILFGLAAFLAGIF